MLCWLRDFESTRFVVKTLSSFGDLIFKAFVVVITVPMLISIGSPRMLGLIRAPGFSPLTWLISLRNWILTGSSIQFLNWQYKIKIDCLSKQNWHGMNKVARSVKDVYSWIRSQFEKFNIEVQLNSLVWQNLIAKINLVRKN